MIYDCLQVHGALILQNHLRVRVGITKNKIVITLDADAKELYKSYVFKDPMFKRVDNIP